MWGDGTIQCQVVLLVWIMVGQGHTVLAVGVGWGQFRYFFSVVYHFSFPPPSVWGGWMDDLILRPFQ